MPSCTVTMDVISKIVTVLCCLFLIAICIYRLITLGGFHLSMIILSTFFMIFSLFLMLAEFKVKFVIRRFRLLGFKLGRSIYCIIIGLLMINQNKFGLSMICAGSLCALGIFHVIEYCVAGKGNKGTDQNYSEFR